MVLLGLLGLLLGLDEDPDPMLPEPVLEPVLPEPVLDPVLPDELPDEPVLPEPLLLELLPY